MKRLSPRFLVLAGAVLTAGIVQGERPRSTPNAYLTALHVHSSMSEGYATMENHIDQAENGGYDGVWFTDHMARQDTWAFPLEVPLDGSLDGPLLPAPISQPAARLETAGPNAGILSLSYSSSSPQQGSRNLRAFAETTWLFSNTLKWARLQLKGHDRAQRMSLLGEPELSFWARLDTFSGYAGFAVRMKLSGTHDGTDDGNLRELELVPANFSAPNPRPGVVRIVLPALTLDQWTEISISPHQYISMFPGGTMDMALIDAELIFYSKQGGKVDVDLDHVQLKRNGMNGAATYAGQRALLDAMPQSSVFTKVGAEVEGPWDQSILGTSSRDHLIALFPGATSVFFPFTAGTPSALNYPQSGVDLIEQNGGASILSHIFGANQDTGVTISSGNYNTLADRVVQNGAWGADGIEIGYPHRGRPLQDFIDVWDDLSDDKVYITGIGSSDIHDMMPWHEWENRWGTWIVAPSDSNQALLDAVKSGDCFFGDPYKLDADGMLYIEDDNGRYVMGDVVPDITNAREEFLVTVEGAAPNSTVVIIRNRSVLDSRPVPSSGSLSYVKKKRMGDADWVRVELRDSQGKVYAMSNPIYFISGSATPPAHRAP